ncbi:hypothetical protein G205_18354 [Arthrobacter nitrophenolicus]|uniref:Uncharacterized protein n=1 Tax=Arthrobacter nitrophenolicus TaxID=683150 RepID=L8TNM7_9MICC|nr:hypothetical protein G205_18354 [Arthrobacter nitrophenolicus]
MDQATAATSAGHVTAVVINAALLWAIHMWPGWQTVPFLTPDTSRVLGAVTLVLVATMLAHLVFLLVPSRIVNALGNLAVLAIGVPAMVQLWEVFPFDFGGTWSGWPVVVRTAGAGHRGPGHRLHRWTGGPVPGRGRLWCRTPRRLTGVKG